MSDWHYVLLVLFTGVSPLAYLSSPRVNPGVASCSDQLSQLYHPLVGLVVKVLYGLLGAEDDSCRAVNLQLHAANTVLLYVVINQLLSSQRMYSHDMRQQTAALCAIFFAVHPARAAVTTQASGIEDSLSMSLCLAGVLCMLPVFANKLVGIYAPATICAFTAASFVKRSAADVPLVVALVVGLEAIKIPAKTGRRLLVGLCLLTPMVLSLSLEAMGWGAGAVGDGWQAHTSSPAEAGDKAAAGKDRAKGNGKGQGEATQPVPIGSSASSAVVSVCIGICEIVGRQLRAFHTAAPSGAPSPSPSPSASASATSPSAIPSNTAASSRQDLDRLAWARDVSDLSPEAAAMLGFFVLALLASVADTIWRCVVGLRARVACVSFLAFAVLCTRSAFPSPRSAIAAAGFDPASAAATTTYLPAAFFSIFLSFALSDAWAGSGSGSGSGFGSGSGSADDSMAMAIASPRRYSRTGLPASPPAQAPPQPRLVRLGFSLIAGMCLLYVAHQFSA